MKGRAKTKDRNIFEQGMDSYDSGMRSVQDALVNLIGGDEVRLGGIQEQASRLAASEGVLNALKYGTPVAALAAPFVEFGDNESYANQAMDLLGMGAGMYGMNYGIDRIGGTTAPQIQKGFGRGVTVAGAGLASLAASDLIQLLLGGGEG